MQSRLTFLQFIKQKNINLKFDQKNNAIAPGQVFRSDSRTFAQIEANRGFQPKTKELSFQGHIFAKPSIYISTSPFMHICMKFCKPISQAQEDHQKRHLQYGSTLYLVNYPKIHVNAITSPVSFFMGKESTGVDFTQTEHEIASVGTIPVEDIYKSRMYFATPGLGFPFVFYGALQLNSSYKHRNYTIGILSAHNVENEMFLQVMYDHSLLSTSLRALTFTEAETVAAMLDQLSQKYTTKLGDPIFTITYVPSTCKDIESVLSYVETQYRQFAAKHWHLAMKSEHTFYLADSGLFATAKANATLSTPAVPEAPRYKK